MAWLVYQGSFKPVRTFTSPQTSLGNLDTASVARLIGAASDVTVVMDGDGVILDTAFQSGQLLEALNDSAGWVGQTFGAVVAPDSRAKTASLLQDAMGHREPKWRHINHRTKDGRIIPVLYCCVEEGGHGRMMAFGRDLSAVSALQQRLIDAQQSMERDYAPLRDIEERYRLLFQQSSDAVLILEPVKGRITEANATASALCGLGTADVSGRPLMEVLDPGGLAGVQAQISSIVAGGQVGEVRILLSHGGRAVTLRMARFPQENDTLVLMCMVPVQPVPSIPTVSDNKAVLLRAVESMPDAFVVTDTEGSVITANTAFREMVQLRHEDEVVGQPLDRWVGATGVDMSVVAANLRSRGVVRFFSTTVGGEHGATAQVEISAVAVPGGGQPALGFAIRNVGARVTMGPQASQTQSDPALPPGNQPSRSVEQLTELIGRVSLKDLVRESTEVIERLAIEAALELTNDNRASAAERLGLSRQSLYVKLRRYGIGDLTAASPA
jgi:transcriptional regulator PpsR